MYLSYLVLFARFFYVAYFGRKGIASPAVTAAAQDGKKVR